MGKFVPKEKMGKKAWKLAATEKQMALAFSPVTRKINVSASNKHGFRHVNCSHVDIRDYLKRLAFIWFWKTDS